MPPNRFLYLAISVFQTRSTNYLNVTQINIRGDRGGSRISGKEVHMYTGMSGWGRFADIISFFKYPMKNEIIWSNYFISVEYLKTGGGSLIIHTIHYYNYSLPN